MFSLTGNVQTFDRLALDLRASIDVVQELQGEIRFATTVTAVLGPEAAIFLVAARYYVKHQRGNTAWQVRERALAAHSAAAHKPAVGTTARQSVAVAARPGTRTITFRDGRTVTFHTGGPRKSRRRHRPGTVRRRGN